MRCFSATDVRLSEQRRASRTFLHFKANALTYRLDSLCSPFLSVVVCGLLAFASAPLSVYAVDRDLDGLNDVLEHRLAEKFAPEWRFNHAVPDDGSNQNQNEMSYPSSVEWFHREVLNEDGVRLLLCFWPDSAFENCHEIASMDDLPAITDIQPPYRRADSADWEGREGELRIYNYENDVGGTPSLFPTYYHVFADSADGLVGIEYYLWFPSDHTAEYLGMEFGDHRGDWENVSVLVEGIDPSDYGQPDIPATAQIRTVLFFGHYSPYKRVDRTDPFFRSVDGTHPQVFVSWGTHAMYPEPGEWHNARSGGPNVYDDFFHGNGVVVRSWSPTGQLRNLGEFEQSDFDRSFEPWIRFRGMWGPDGSPTSGSPLSPPFKGRWGLGEEPCNCPAGDVKCSGNCPWSRIKTEYWSRYWENPPEIDGAIPWPGGWLAHGVPRCIVFHHDHWRTDTGGCTGGFYEEILADGESRNLSCENNGSSAVLLLGGAQLELFSEPGLAGTRLLLTHSCEDLKRHYGHNFGDTASSARCTSQHQNVSVDRANADGYQDGSSATSALAGPYASLGLAVAFADTGATVTVKAGQYPESLTIGGTLTIFATSGVAEVGQLAVP